MSDCKYNNYNEAPSSQRGVRYKALAKKQAPIDVS